MEQIESKYRDPESKTKLKQIKNDAEKQIQRNKVILKDFINKYHPFKTDLLQGNREETRETMKIKIINISKEERLTMGQMEAIPKANRILYLQMNQNRTW